jgi:hypothetical protein
MNINLSTKNLLRPLNGRSIPTPVLLCIAALLGSVSIMLASNTFLVAHHGAQANASHIVIIIPARAQKQVALSLPD